MKKVLVCAALVSVVTAFTLLPVSSTVGKQPTLISSGQSERGRQRVPTRKIGLTVPEQPPQAVQLYCCNAAACFPVDAFKACIPGELKMVCDVDGICVPINPISVRGNKLLFSAKDD